MCALYPQTQSYNPREQNGQKVTTQGVKGQNQGVYVGSKQGNKFHLPDCPGAKQISDANKVWFLSKEEAISRGYTPALNCKGL